MEKKIAFLSLGGNIGNRIEYINKAIEFINNFAEIQVLKRSSCYETKPIGYKEQDSFINVCIMIETTLAPMKLLVKFQEIEKKLKSKKLFRWGPRTIDIDILLYDDVKIDSAILKLPHPRMTERQFVLIPLKEIEPDLLIEGRTIDDYLSELENQGVNKLVSE